MFQNGCCNFFCGKHCLYVIEIAYNDGFSECDDIESTREDCVRLCQDVVNERNSFRVDITDEGYFSFYNQPKNAYLCKDVSDASQVGQ